MNGSLKSSIQLGLALLLALSAGILVYQSMQSRAAAGRVPAVRTAPLVVAARDLSAGTKLAPDMLRTQDYPETMMPAQHYATAAEVSGRILASGMSANEPLTPSRLAGEAAAGGISAVITPGKRAMAVKGNKVMGLAGLIRPGNMVDVLVTLPMEGQNERHMTKVVLENVPVLAAGSQMTTDKDEAAQSADIYTLELTPQESEKVPWPPPRGPCTLPCGAPRTPRPCSPRARTPARPWPPTVCSGLCAARAAQATPWKSSPAPSGAR